MRSPFSHQFMLYIIYTVMISSTVILLGFKLLSKTKLKDKIVDKLVRQTKKPEHTAKQKLFMLLLVK